MDPEPSPQTLGFSDDGGLWMKMDSNCVNNHTGSPPEACDESPPDEAFVLPPGPAVVPRYYGVMDDEGADDVFIPPPPPPPLPPPPPAPSDVGLLLPAGTSAEETARNSAVTLSGGAADATEPKANPGGLERPHGENQLTTASRQVDEERAGPLLVSQECTDNTRLPEHSSPSSRKGAGCPAEQCRGADDGHYHGDSSGGEDTNEDVLTFSGETEAKTEEYLKEKPSGDLGGESCTFTEGDKRVHVCGFDKTDSELSEENMDINTGETNVCILPGFKANEDGFRSSPQTENETEGNQPQVEDGNKQVDGRSLDFNLTKYSWLRRESGSVEISRVSEEIQTSGEEEDEGGRIASDIQRGEQLLQRLQLLQLRHDANTPGIPCEVSQEVRGQQKVELETDAEALREGGGNQTNEEEKDEESLMEKEKNQKNGSKDAQGKTSPWCTGEPDQEIPVSTEAGDSDDQSDMREPAALSPLDFHETSIDVPFLSTGHRLSVAETSIERQIQEEAQRKQNLQRAGGVFNLSDDPDVLEIPFKTNISLDSLPSTVGTSQRSSWQFSDLKMKKETNQEIQRELAPVNQRKIPGGVFRKGEASHIKETKLLFEAFQQDNTGGPTRYRKPPSSPSGGHIYPSVLERTRSLEMFASKSIPVSRAHSLRLCKAATPDKSLENLRVKSPTVGLRDKTRLSPYSKQDKHHRLYKSMDSISTAASALSVENKSKEDTVRQKSPILQQNPFFKLRPALALQPEVEKDIREAKEREEELQRQRCSLYGQKKQLSEDEDRTQKLPDVRHQSRGKLERVWPPPSKKDQKKSEQQEPRAHRAGGPRAPLWQRWESGLINGQPAKKQK